MDADENGGMASYFLTAKLKSWKGKVTLVLARGPYVRTCRFLEFRERRFIDIIVDLVSVSVVPDKQKVGYVWLRLIVLPECQAEPAHQNNPSVTKQSIVVVVGGRGGKCEW